MRTIKRDPMNAELTTAKNIKKAEQYFNFAEFKGICTNKNHIAVDQTTFEDADNVYINDDYELHTRPPLVENTKFGAGIKVLKLFKFGDLIVYNIQDGSTYKLQFTWPGTNTTTTINILRDVQILWHGEEYIVFTGNDNEAKILAFYYNYNNSSVKVLQANQGSQADQDEYNNLFYVPTTKIVGGEDVKAESPNILTNKYLVKYVLTKSEAGTLVIHSDLLGKTATLHIGEAEYTLTFTNITSFLAVDVQSTATILNTGTLSNMVVTDINYFTRSTDYAYISLDGIIFHAIPLPTYANACTISKDGRAIFAFSPNTETIYVYNCNVGTVFELLSGTWSKYTISPSSANYGCNLWYGGTMTNNQKDMTSTSWTFDDFIAFDHAIYADNFESFVVLCPTRMTFKTKTVQGNGYSDPSSNTGATNQSDYFMLIKGTINSAHTSYSVVCYLLPELSYSSSYEYDIYNKVTNDGELILINRWNSASMSIQGMYIKNDILHCRFWGFNYGSSKVVYKSYLQNIYSTSNLRMWSGFNRGHSIRLSGVSNAFVASIITNSSSDNTDRRTLRSITVTLSSSYSSSDYINQYTYGTGDNRTTNPISFSTNSSVTELATGQNTGKMFVQTLDGSMVLSSTYLYTNNTKNNLLHSNVIPIHIDNSNMIYGYNGILYSNAIKSIVYAEILYTDNPTEIFVPSFVNNFIVDVITKNNKLYPFGIADEKKKLYIPKADILTFEADIAGLANFSNTSLGVFLSNKVFEYQYSEGNFYLTPTKLQLGNSANNEILQSYDGASIFLCTLKGLSALTYQDFVQSTEQVYSYLTENIADLYTAFAGNRIKLYQYKNWIFMYSPQAKHFYLFDVRNNSWWKWTNPHNVDQILFDGDKLNVILEQKLYCYDLQATHFVDDIASKISWKIVSRKIHFNAPNNYKHVTNISILVDDSALKRFRYKLTLINYHNLYNLQDTDIDESPVDTLTTVLKKVNFIKTNAFQFVLENDDTDDNATHFSTSNIAIKYRVTERLR